MVGGDRQIAERFGVDPITARVLLNRGLRDEDQIRKFLHGTLEDLEDPRSMDQLEEAARLLMNAFFRTGKSALSGIMTRMEFFPCISCMLPCARPERM